MLLHEDTIFCVMWISTGKILYEGTNDRKAADKLIKGTIFGYGGDKKEAFMDCDSRRRKILLGTW